MLRHVRLTSDRAQLDLDHFRSLLSPRTKLVSLVHVSNVLGCVLDTDLVAEEVRLGARPGAWRRGKRAGEGKARGKVLCAAGRPCSWRDLWG